MMLFWGLIAAVPLALVLALLAIPRVVEYVETITVRAGPRAVYDAIRFQARLMEWSAWPPETGSACKVEGTDGERGARTVFLDKRGARFGHQEITAMEDGASVSFRLESKGPPQRPGLHFHLVPLATGETRVVLHFRNAITPPFNLLLHLAGIVRWTRAMHGKDLAGLKRYVEDGETYLGERAKAA